MNAHDFAYRRLDDLEATLLALTRKNLRTLVVKEGHDAHEMALNVAMGESEIVLMVNNADDVTGVILPKKLQLQIELAIEKQTDSLVDAMDQLSNAPIVKVAQLQNQFTGGSRPDIVWCEKCKRYTDDLDSCSF